jgi:SAM-dependent methyltransferase
MPSASVNSLMSESKPITPSCPYCLSGVVLETLAAKEMTQGTRDVFHFAICKDCGSAYITDFPDNISDYYEGYYSFEDATLTLEQLWWKRMLVTLYANTVVRGGFSFLFRSFFRCPSPRQMKVLSPNLQAFMFLGAKPNARILDVGTGIGQFVKMMRRFGYSCATGIDPFLDQDLETNYVRRCDIQSATGTYDAILFNHSLEHMTDPEATLKRCADLLAPDGTVLIHVPNMAARDFAEFRQDWFGLHAPYHFAVPSRRGMEMMSSRCGFKVVDAVCTSRYELHLFSEEYSRNISDRDANSVRRQLESNTFDEKRRMALSKVACSLNKTLSGESIAYYLTRPAA